MTVVRVRSLRPMLAPRIAGMRLAALSFAAVLGSSRVAHAVEITKLDQKPVKLDVTATSLLLQRFDAREDINARDSGWGGWLNKLNAQLSWKKWSLAMRLDSSLYWRRPEDRDYCADGCTFTERDRPGVARDGAVRFRDQVFLAKIWASYKDPAAGLEVILGDAYAQLGRGLVLSLRKVDELGIDTTVRGAKVTFQKKPISVTLLAGFLNPSRTDEATGQALFPSRPIAGDNRGSQPLYGSDRVMGIQLLAGRGLPVQFSTHAARFSRCAPFRYQDDGRIDDGFLSQPFGSCDNKDISNWLGSLPTGLNPLLRASGMDSAGQTLEIPSLFKHGSLYLEAAFQRARYDAEAPPRDPIGNAIYGSLVTTIGPVTNTLEIKSYRNFYGLPGAVNSGRVLAFSPLQYNNLPTTEPLIQDSMFGNYNACVDGGRLRSDVRLQDGLVVYGAVGYYRSKTETPGTSCDRFGNQRSSEPEGRTTTRALDALAGVEWSFNKSRSQVLVSLGLRDDRRSDGTPYYTEKALNYSVSLFLKAPYSIEFTGRHRIRFQDEENRRGPNGESEHWRQGFHNTALKIAPKWVLAQGVEYTTLLGFPTYYLNASMLYRFTSESNVKVLVGQQQGGLRCVSGVCRVLPAFEGARAELTLRF
jgi:Family of unknown function (DUF6029)